MHLTSSRWKYTCLCDVSILGSEPGYHYCERGGRGVRGCVRGGLVEIQLWAEALEHAQRRSLGSDDLSGSHCGYCRDLK